MGNYLNMDDLVLQRGMDLGGLCFLGVPLQTVDLYTVMDSLEVMFQANQVEIISSKMSLQGLVWHRICRMTAQYSARTKAGPSSKEFSLILMSFVKLLNNSIFK